MKLSISLAEDDVRTLDEFVRATGLSSRSAAVQRAVQLLRHSELEDDYVAAWQEWEQTDDARLWDATSGDGIDDAPR